MNKNICLVPKLSGLGGTSSFQAKLIQGLNTRGIPYTYDLMHPGNTAVLVVGGTRQLWKLWRAKQRGVWTVQRLDGMNWMHRVKKTNLRFFLRSEVNNRVLAFIRRHLADYIVYQSDFSRDWWDRVWGDRPLPHQVTYNGVDLEQYSPIGPETPPSDHYRILLVEGRLIGAYARGLHMAINLAEALKTEYDLKVELVVVGLVSDALKARAHTLAPNLWLTWGGVVPREDIPAIDRAAHVLFSTDLNAACPNSVIEAMACGLPVLAYDTGALAEIVQDGAGEVVPYGADHWQLADPQVPSLAEACLKILQNNPAYRRHARARAETAFGLDEMVTGYLAALEAK